MLIERSECCSEGKAATYSVVLLGTQLGVALSGGMMKRNIFKKLSDLNKKLALCLIISGFTAMNTGFTENGELAPQPAVETEIAQTSATEPTAIAVGENGRIKVSEDDELSQVLIQLVENSQSANVETPSDETQAIETPSTETQAIETPSDETQAADISTIKIVEPAVESVPVPENIIDTGRGSVPYAQMYTMEATAYLPTDGSPEGLTAMGIPATYGIVAVDPDVIPLGTRVYVPGYGEALAADTGGAIYGYRIDLCMESYDAAMEFGRRDVTVFVLK